jgi:hypothetical protein
MEAWVVEAFTESFVDLVKGIECKAEAARVQARAGA